VFVDGEDVTAEIRAREVAALVSEVSAHPGVREQMVAAQRALMSSGDWVSDGRDVGSTVWPDAEVKVFLTATPEERARRRRAELAAGGLVLDEAQVLEDVHRRDELDTSRAASPLRVADGAVVIDSSDLDAGDVADRVMSLVAALAGGD
jgi:CMP/dCMP kinase